MIASSPLKTKFIQMKLKFLLLITVFLVKTGLANAEIVLPSLIGDGMVLQQNTTINIWGKATKNSKITIKVSWKEENYGATADNNGNWEIKIPTISGGFTKHTITIVNGTDKVVLKDILLGEVWLAGGQSNMEMNPQGLPHQPLNNAIDEILDFDYPYIRFFLVKRAHDKTPKEDVEGNWTLPTPETVKNFSTIGFNFSKILNKTLKMPVGIIGCYWGGTKIEAWISDEAIQKVKADNKDIRIIDTATSVAQTPSILYNGMVHPIRKYQIAGCIFYQGESNVMDPKAYSELFPAMIADWRKSFNKDFTFLYVQIAPYNYDNRGWKSDGIEAALFREVQILSQSKIPKSGIVSTTDVGAEFTIHPPEKRPVAKRLAYLALAKVYYQGHFEALAPQYVSHKIEDNFVSVRFKNVALGLTTFYQEYEGFEVAGEDGVFLKAKVRKKKGTRDWLELYNDKVAKPVAARYGFRNYIYGNLYNSYGIAALPFRTDK